MQIFVFSTGVSRYSIRIKQQLIAYTSSILSKNATAYDTSHSPSLYSALMPLSAAIASQEGSLYLLLVLQIFKKKKEILSGPPVLHTNMQRGLPVHFLANFRNRNVTNSRYIKFTLI